jgi:parallel beta-helix repeat protein
MKIQHAYLFVVLVGFLLLNGLSIVNLTQQVSAAGRDIYVDDDFYYPRDGTAEHPYQKISEAINLANEGDTIYVFGGIYNETLTINKPKISLIGGIDDGPSRIARNAELKYLVEITADFVTLENFVIEDEGRRITSLSGALVHVTSSNVVLQKNNISHCALWGIYLDSSDDNTISGNNLNDTKGVLVSSSHNNVFSSNGISNASDSGINLRSANRNILYENVITTSNFGIYSKDCSIINITSNTITKNKYHGVYLTGDRDDLIQGNLFKNNTVNGLTLDAYDCIISDNIFNRGQIGISLQKTGCQIYSNSFENMSSTSLSTTQGSANNVIFLNHFTDNNVNAREQGSNQWDDGAQGNYWDDYNYVDRNLDGIGDRSYAIATGGVDQYPLGVFLQPPHKPSNPSPADDRENVGLKVTLWVTVNDPDSNFIREVAFYNAADNTYLGSSRNVANGKNASWTLSLPFDTTYAWYVIANDSLQQNQSDIWFFTTKQRPPENQKPVANPGGPYVTKLNQSVSFDGSQSSDPDGSVIFYRWNFGDGSSQILDMTPHHTYTDPGSYVVTLTVVDDDGRSSMANTTATIQGEIYLNSPPVAMFTSPTTVIVNQEVFFDASGSSDTDGAIVEYRWDFDSDGVFDIDWLNTSAITFTFPAPGSSYVTLEVKDDKGAVSSFSANILVNPVQEKTPGFDILLVFCAMLIGLYFISLRRR